MSKQMETVNLGAGCATPGDGLVCGGESAKWGSAILEPRAHLEDTIVPRTVENNNRDTCYCFPDGTQ